AYEVPVLAPLVEQRAGGQRHLLEAGPAPGTVGRAGSLPTMREVGATDAPSVTPEIELAADEAAPEMPAQPAAALSQFADNARARRPVRYGLSIGFEARPDDPELGRLVESTVWVNEAHPAYRRAVASRSEGYHLALAVALALAPLASEPANEHAFVIAFLERWGEALEPGGRRGRGR